MKPAPFSYRRPGTLPEALEALAGDPKAKVLAGGQSLVPLLSMRLAAPTALVDINGLPDLDHVTVTADGVRVGALARHADVLAHEAAGRCQPLLPLALSNVAHATIRNRGTTVGSIVHADAAAEMPAVLALRDNFTVYDAAYLVLARALACPLVTADTTLLPAQDLGVDVQLLRSLT